MIANDKQIAVDGSGNDGGMLYWEPEEMRIPDLTAALKKIELENLAPKHSVVGAALQDAFMTFIEKAKIKERGKPIKPFRLSAEVTGFDARQIVPGDENIDPVFVASVLLDTNGHVRIPKHNSAILPQLDNHKTQVEAVLQKVFDHRCTYYPTGMVSGWLFSWRSNSKPLMPGMRISLTKTAGRGWFLSVKNDAAFAWALTSYPSWVSIFCNCQFTSGLSSTK
jgi:hypothetical protein